MFAFHKNSSSFMCAVALMIGLIISPSYATATTIVLQNGVGGSDPDETSERGNESPFYSRFPGANDGGYSGLSGDENYASGGVVSEGGETTIQSIIEETSKVVGYLSEKKSAQGMKTSQIGINFIASHEGLRTKVYLDPVGLPTIGYGHLIKRGESIPNTITVEQAKELLRQDLATAESYVIKNVHVPITQGQFDALVSFTYNLGGGGFERSSVLAKLNAGDTAGATTSLLAYCKGTINGKLTKLAGLVRRRSEEATMFNGTVS
ncbi:MAG: lysozyme [Alphaproteobacteria bacterium]|nr:lysozyme [Alphaproteobacteria bacterium]